MSSKFDGSSGMKPSAEARRYIYACLAQTLCDDLYNAAGYIFDDLDEFDTRRAKAAAQKVIVELRRKAGARP